MQWTASLYEVESWAILKGSPNLRAATQFLYFAGTPAIEARLVELFGEGGLAKGANDGLPAELAQTLADHPGQPERRGSRGCQHSGMTISPSCASSSRPG